MTYKVTEIVSKKKDIKPVNIQEESEIVKKNAIKEKNGGLRENRSNSDCEDYCQEMGL